LLVNTQIAFFMENSTHHGFPPPPQDWTHAISILVRGSLSPESMTFVFALYPVLHYYQYD